jgi:hypothetical protein
MAALMIHIFVMDYIVDIWTTPYGLLLFIWNGM